MNNVQIDKREKYESILSQIDSVLEGETNTISIMSTICGILKETMDYFYWVGFYIEDNGVLKVGPYQGTLGCLTISFDRGICGRAYRFAETQIVSDTHADVEHISCDPNSNSEIVIPVRNKRGSIIAVFDVDSSIYGAFDSIDQHYLELIIRNKFEK